MFKSDDLFDLGTFRHRAIFDGTENAWEALSKIAGYLKANLKPALHNKAIGNPFIAPDVFIGEGTVVEEGAFIKGPAIIGSNCEIRHGAYIRGNVITGDNCVLGNSCEFKNCLLLDHVQVPHFSYVGDAILGNHSHLGAGVICSNLKLSTGNVILDYEGKRIDTGLRKFSVLLGDDAEVGCNSVLNPGSIIGRRSLLYPGTQWRGILGSEQIVKTRLTTHIVGRRS